MTCTYVYSGRAGGPKGAACGRAETDHCKGPANDPDDTHDDTCKLYEGDDQRRVKPRPMVHHPFHRRQSAAPPRSKSPSPRKKGKR